MIRILSRQQLLEKAERFIDSAFGTPAPDHVLLVEIGPNANYDRLHAFRAIHFCETQCMNEETVRAYFPHREKEIVLYSDRAHYEELWRVARRLEQLGYGQLHIYEPGGEQDAKLDWVLGGLTTQSGLTPADSFDPIELDPAA